MRWGENDVKRDEQRQGKVMKERTMGPQTTIMKIENQVTEYLKGEGQ